jgi:phosphate:Na+ symporter
MTGWLVALVGLKFKIELLALPLIGIGMALRLTGETTRRGAFGTALAGFGVLFLGIDMLREAFTGVSAQMSLPQFDGPLGVVLQVGIGILMTVLMQSSSASLTIALTAAQGGLLTDQGAAAMVIGANIGTTVTAVLAAIGATANARRAAAAHVLFNVLTGIVALLLLPWLLALIESLRVALGLDSAPAAKLALFHTTFNVLGVILIWPVAERMTRMLQARFRVAEEDAARPQYLDQNVLAVPGLALQALEHELRRIGAAAIALSLASMRSAGLDRDDMAKRKGVIVALGQACDRFVSDLNRASLSDTESARLAELLRIERYYEHAADLAEERLRALHDAAPTPPDLGDALERMNRHAEQLLQSVDPERPPVDGEEREAALAELEHDYQELKAALLRAGARGSLRVADMDAWLSAWSASHRAVQQAVKAMRLLPGSG